MIAAVPGTPVLVGSGVTAANAERCLAGAAGVLVGTAVKEDSILARPVDPARVRELVRSARSVWGR